MKNRAVFLDRDGNINKDVGYPNSYDLIDIFPSSFKAVRKINEAGFLAVIITNQSGIGRGLIQEKSLLEIHKKMQAAFEKHKAFFDGIYYCPHYHLSEEAKYKKDCLCRKPNPGMGHQAAAELNIDTTRSYMIGDKKDDILFGINIHAKPILVQTGYGKDSLPTLKDEGIEPTYVAPDLLNAVNWILKQEKNF